MTDFQTMLQGKKTYIVLGLAAFLHYAKQKGVDFGGIDAETLFGNVEPYLLGLAALFKQAADQRAALAQSQAEKDLTIVRLSKEGK